LAHVEVVCRRNVPRQTGIADARSGPVMGRAARRSTHEPTKKNPPESRLMKVCQRHPGGKSTDRGHRMLAQLTARRHSRGKAATRTRRGDTPRSAAWHVDAAVRGGRRPARDPPSIDRPARYTSVLNFPDKTRQLRRQPAHQLICRPATAGFRVATGASASHDRSSESSCRVAARTMARPDRSKSRLLALECRRARRC